MAETNIKISGLGDVARADLVRAMTDPDKFREFADQQGWGNKRRQLAWNSVHDYAQGVSNGDINEINDMRQIVDDTGVRTNKKERYNLIGSKFDANGATAAYMNSIAKGLSTANKPAEKTLKSIPSTTSYLSKLWFGSDNPDWELFQKNDVLGKNGAYETTNRAAKLKQGLQSLKDELTTHGAEYNWDGIDREATINNLTNAINSANVATYAPLGITSDFINSALATRSLATPIDSNDENEGTTQTQSTTPSTGLTDDQILAMPGNEDLAALVAANPAKKADYLAQARQRVANQITLNEQSARARTDESTKTVDNANFTAWLKANGHYSPAAQFTSTVAGRIRRSSITKKDGSPTTQVASNSLGTYLQDTSKYSFSNDEWKRILLQDPSDKDNVLENASRTLVTNDGKRAPVVFKNKWDWFNYKLDYLISTGKINDYAQDVSKAAGRQAGTVFKFKNSYRSTDGTWLYGRKVGNKLELYRHKTFANLRKEYDNQKISKKQDGGAFAKQAYADYQKYLNERKAATEKQQKLSKATKEVRVPFDNTPRTKEQVSAGQRELGSLKGLSASDYSQLAGIALDLGSTTATFLPGAGNIVGAGLGLAGTAAHAGSDFTNSSVSTGEALTNLGMNLAFDVAGAIPVLGSYGKLAKLGRIGKTLANNTKLISVLTTACSAPGIINAAPNAASAIQKFSTGNWKKITADELRDTATAIAILMGTGKTAKNQLSIVQKNPKRGDSVTVKTTKGKQTIKTSEYEEIMQKPTLTQRNDLLRIATGDENIKFDNGLFHNYAPESWNPTKFTGFLNKINPLSQVRNTTDPELKYIFKTPQQIAQEKAAKNSQGDSNTNNQSKSYTPEQKKADIEFLRKRFTSDVDQPITEKTKQVYTRYMQKSMSAKQIKRFEDAQKLKRAERQSNRDYLTYDQINAENRAAQMELTNAFRNEELAIAQEQAKLKSAQVDTQLRNLPGIGQRVVTPESVRTEANRQFALSWVPDKPKPQLKGAARAKKQAMYEQLFPPFEIVGTGSPVQHPSRRSVESRRRLQEAVQQEFLERQRRENAVILHPAESRPSTYQQMFSPVLTTLDNEARAMGMRAKPSGKDIKATKSTEIHQQRKYDRAKKASEVMEAFKSTSSNNTKGHNKNTNLPHKQSNKKKKTSRDNNIKRRQDGGILYDYNFLKSVHAFQKGGIIKAQAGIKYNNIYAGEGEDYSYDNYLNKYFQNGQMLAYMRNHYNTIDDYAKDVMNNVNGRFKANINDYNNSTTYSANQNVYDFNKGYQNEGTRTFNYTMFGNNADDYVNKTNGVSYNLIKGWVRPKGMHTGDSYNSNAKQAYIDGAHGLQTYSRVMSLTNKDIKSGGFGEWGDSWKAKGATGAYYYIADGDTSGRGQWIPTTDTTKKGYIAFDAPQPTDTTTAKQNSSETTPSGENIGKKNILQKASDYLKGLSSNPGNLYNAVETLKYGLAQKATNDIFKIKAPNQVRTKGFIGYQTNDDLSKWNAYTSAGAATLNYAAKNPATSSGQLQAAQMYDAMNAKNKSDLAGATERNAHLEADKQQTYKAGVYNMEHSVDNANTNAQLAHETRMRNEYYDPRDKIRAQATNRQNWINALEKFNVIDPYTERKNAIQQYGLAKAQWDYSNNSAVDTATANYRKAVKEHANDANWDPYSSDQWKAVQNAQKKATADYYNNLYSIYGIKNPGFSVTTAKKGGKFEDISKFNTKEFYNSVRHSINTAVKQGGNIGNLTTRKSNRK